MSLIRMRDDLHTKAARALLRAAFINGCRFRFRRYIPINVPRKSFVLRERKAALVLAVVFIQVLDPVSLGVVKSIARPGGNITGLAQGPQILWSRRGEVC
jgi:hypothetical protein